MAVTSPFESKVTPEVGKAERSLGGIRAAASSDGNKPTPERPLAVGVVPPAAPA